MNGSLLVAINVGVTAFDGIMSMMPRLSRPANWLSHHNILIFLFFPAPYKDLYRYIHVSTLNHLTTIVRNMPSFNESLQAWTSHTPPTLQMASTNSSQIVASS